MEFEPGSFDVATLVNVGMNIADKACLFAEARRALRPSGVFAIYDLMRMDAGEIPYPMPWAATAETSFIETPAVYRRLLEAAGFAVGLETNRREEALELAAERRKKAERGGPSALGPQLLMGAAAAERVGNVAATVRRGTIAPVQMLARAV